ncbi:paraquat-inducible protein A [Klebsiella michiganensis]|nr:paraquat-inducible protein A [Klebsiella michiganensis]
MKIFPHLIICPHCDSVYQKQRAAPGYTARCSRCHAVLWQGDRSVSDHLLPLALASGISFILTCCLPVMSVGFLGVIREITLMDVVCVPGHGGSNFALAAGILFLFLIAPGLQIILTVWLLLFSRFRHPAPGFILTMKLLKWISPWSMVDVTVLGFLVAGIKLTSQLDVSAGPGGYALAAASFLMLIVSHHDLQPLWSLLPAERNENDA